MAISLRETLDEHSREGELSEKLQGSKVRCYACAHRCVIFEGKRGICQVRFNRGGRLYVPWGYVGALQLDPIEKKPFFHVLPGARALTFGMLGCDLHCPYCFPGETPVVTDQGVLPIEVIFERGQKRLSLPAGEASRPPLQVMGSQGVFRPLHAAFKHFYQGELVVIKPFYLPPLRCTPDHRLYVTTDPDGGRIEVLPAHRLTTRHYLVMPKRYAFSRPIELDTIAILQASGLPRMNIPHRLGQDGLRMILSASAAGTSSWVIGAALGKDPSYIRHVRSKVGRGLWRDWRFQDLAIEGNLVRFLKEHRPGIPKRLSLDERLATLLGYYCAEGCVTRAKDRPHSLTLNFSLGPRELAVVEKIYALIRELFDLDAKLTRHTTTLRVHVDKASLARLFAQLCGAVSKEKHVPEALFEAPEPVARAFLEAYILGDGHRYPNGKVSVTTKAAALAYGLAWLVLRLGYLPSLYKYRLRATKIIEGRRVRQSPEQYTLVWYESPTVPRRYQETDEYYLIPIRAMTHEPYDGPVYDLEVNDPNHNYLAGFFLTKNCQNWQISQALRDKNAGAHPQVVTPSQLVELAQHYHAQAIVSSYNEPLITSEWAAAVFQEAKRAGLLTGYVSNGNATREVLQYLKPHLDCYKIDLKTMQDRNYRVLGAVLKNILDGIAMVYESGFWMEIVTLVIPGFNDSDEELRQMAKFLASISPDIPWHVTAFHKDYKMLDPDNTPASTLIRAAQIGYEAGLHFVYAGNLPGETGCYENTYCPRCGALLIERYGFWIHQNRLREGRCPHCDCDIPGIWK